MVSHRSLAVPVAALALLAVACTSDDRPPPTDDQSGTVGGRVLMTLDAPLVGAQVSIDHLEYLAATPQIRGHVGDRTTDAAGHFEIPTGLNSGYFLITTRGGSFVDYATGQTVVLDPSDELTALLYTDLLEDLTTGLVTPITHLAHRLIVARTTAGLDRSLVDSHTLVNAHLDQHFGGLRWERAAPASLAAHATSPTDEVRAAFVLAAWSMMARDIAAAAGQSAQEVNPYTLALDLGEDIAAPPFDGNDGNAWMASGLQLGACATPDPSCVPTGGGCALGACRTACDAYAGTPRTTLAAAITSLISDNGPDGRNQTGLSVADALSFARAVATNTDPILFGDACVDEVDRLAPTLTWGAQPADGAIVRGAVAFTVAAVDNVDPAPVVTWGDSLPDTDGAPASAATTIDTALAIDRTYVVRATATDAAGNAVTGMRTVTADNTAPVLTVASVGFLVDGATWWTTAASPTLTGTVADDHGPITIEARILGQLAAMTTTAASGAWSLTLPAGALGASGSAVVLRAVDAIGNATADSPTTSPFLRADADAPALTWDTAGVTLLGPDYWTTTTAPTLTGTATDPNLATVVASWPGGSAPAVVTAGAWSVTLAGLDIPGRDVTITATDRAGNGATLTRRLRADATPPVAGFGTTTVYREDQDVVEFGTTLVGGVRSYNPNHSHVAASATSLGPPTACDATAPRVVKFAYLLDEAPPYVTQSGGTDTGPGTVGHNSLKWQLAPTDDGVGLASARYRVVRVDTGATIIDWTPLASPVSTIVSLYRVGAAGAAALGTAQGLLRIEHEATDRLGRAVTASRCWNQQLLAAPIAIDTVVGPATTTTTAGKYALAGLDLATAASPVSLMTVPPTATTAAVGAGLYEFAVYNPTREPIYLSIDVLQTTNGRYTKTYYNNKWVYRDVTTNYDCAAVGTPGDWAPDYDRPNCAVADPPPGTQGLQSNGPTPSTIPSTDYGVRLWSTDQVSSTLTELPHCGGCSTTAAASSYARITVLLPPRGPVAAPPVKVWVMPTLRPSANYQPGGSTAEVGIAGVEVTGAATGTVNKCIQWNLPIPYTFAAMPTYRCTRTRQFTQARYVKHIDVTNIIGLNALAFTGLDGGVTTQPSHLSGIDNRRDYLVPATVWDTTEITEPSSL